MLAKAKLIPPRILSYQELDILHCLRGFCSFYVVIYHAKYVLWAGGTEYLNAFPRATWTIMQYVAFALDMLSSAGYEMVVFFFVLSGFFIRYAQLRKPRVAKDFYLNRIVRIYPPYIFSMILAIVVLAIVVHWVPQIISPINKRELNTSLSMAWNDLCAFNFLKFIRALLFLPVQGAIYVGYNSVYWSLLPEALFYVAVPLAFWRIRAYYVTSIVAYLVGIVLVVLKYNQVGFLDFFLKYNFYFAVGVALYDIITRTDWLARVRRMPSWLLLLTVIVLFSVLLPLALLKLKVISGLVAVILAVLAVSILLAGRVSHNNLVLRFFHPIGIFSFSLYLYHFPLLILLNGILTALTGDVVFYNRYYWLAIPVVTGSCYVLYWITERVSINLFRKV